MFCIFLARYRSFKKTDDISDVSNPDFGCFVLSVFLSLYRSKATLFAFSGQRPAVKAPYQLLSMFQSLSLSPRQTESLCLVTAVCLHADYHESGPEQESLISNEVKSCNQYKQTQTTQLTDLK